MPGWIKLALELLCLVVILPSSASSASRPASLATRTVAPPRPAWCAYVTALPAPVLAAPVLPAPSAGAKRVKLKDLGNGIEILPLPHPPGWWPVYTPFSPGQHWMPADVLRPRVAGTRPCPDQAVAAVTAYNSDTEEQFAVGSDCRVYHRWQWKAGGPFDRWAPMGGCASGGHGLAVGKNGDGELVAFVIWPDHTVRYRSQSRPGLGPWTGWASLGGSFSTGLRVVSASSGSSPIQVLARDGSGHLWENEQTQGSWRGWLKVGRH